MKLYRGVSKDMDEGNQGRLLPKGSELEITPLYDGNIKYDGTFTYGPTADNAARAHQIKTGLYNGRFVSTSKCERTAICFATNGYTKPGFVYVIDSTLLEKYNIIAKEFSDPLHPEHSEVSLALAIDSTPPGKIIPLPKEIVIDKYEVNSDGLRIGG